MKQSVPGSWARNIVAWLTLPTIRIRLSAWPARVLALAIAATYMFISMLLGQMLILQRVGGSYFVQVLWSGNGTHWWDYPGLLAVQPWGVLELPFFPSIMMVLVSIGVGIGGAVGLILVIPALGRRLALGRRERATGAAAGVGPAIAGLATVGACCCTGCISAAGIAVVAAASGSSITQLLLNDWYIGVFQVVIVYVSLLAQERALRRTTSSGSPAPTLSRRFAVGALLRSGLLVAGVTWSLAMFVEWSYTSPLTASGATWYHWIFEHQLLSLVAVLAGLFPGEFVQLIHRFRLTTGGGGLRVVLAIAAVSWGVWVPAFLVPSGLGGFLNEFFGYVGASSMWGATAPDAAIGGPLLFHWIFQHLLLSAFALGLAVAPESTVRPLQWTLEASARRPTSVQQPQGRQPSPESPIAVGPVAGTAELSQRGKPNLPNSL